MENSMKKFPSLALLSLACTCVYASTELIIKFKPTQEERQLLQVGKLNHNELRQRQMAPLTECQLHLIETLAGMPVADKAALATGAHLISFKQDLTESELNHVIEQLKRDKALDYISPNAQVHLLNNKKDN
jgi:hypothetical protein